MMIFFPNFAFGGAHGFVNVRGFFPYIATLHSSIVISNWMKNKLQIHPNHWNRSTCPGCISESPPEFDSDGFAGIVGYGSRIN